MTDFSRSVQPSTSSNEVKIAEVKELVTENRHSSLREIASELSVSHELIRTISIDCLCMKRVPARLVPKDLNFLKKLIEYHLTTTVFTYYGSGRLFSFSKAQITTSRYPFSVDMRHKRESRRELKSIPRNAFEKCFDDWIIRWHKCIISGGAYFEGDKINLDE